MRFRAYPRTPADERWAIDVELDAPPTEDSVVMLPDGRGLRVTHLLDTPAGYHGAFAADEIDALRA